MDKLDLVSKKIMIKVDDQVSKKLSEDWHILEKQIEELKAIDTTGIEPMVRIDSTPDNILREDIPGKSLSKDKVMKNAPKTLDGFIEVPKVVSND